MRRQLDGTKYVLDLRKVANRFKLSVSSYACMPTKLVHLYAGTDSKLLFGSPNKEYTWPTMRVRVGIHEADSVVVLRKGEMAGKGRMNHENKTSFSPNN